MEKYKLNVDTTEDNLRNEGFRHGIFRCYVFKHIVQLVVYVDIGEKWWSYQVQNTDSNTLFVPYYDRLYGVNDIVKEIDRKVESILLEMSKKNILIEIESNM